MVAGVRENICLEIYVYLNHSTVVSSQIISQKKLKTKLRDRSPQANYTDRATADCRRS
jgi:hypothetical protein